MDLNIAYLTADIGRLFRKRLDIAGRPLGITGAQLRVLLLLGRNPGLNQSELASMLEVEAITAGRMIDRMAAADLVERRPDPADRRVWRLYPTNGGTDLITQLAGEVEQMLKCAVKGLDDDECKVLDDLLARVRANLIEQTQEEVAEAVNG